MSAKTLADIAGWGDPTQRPVAVTPRRERVRVGNAAAAPSLLSATQSESPTPPVKIAAPIVTYHAPPPFVSARGQCPGLPGASGQIDGTGGQGAHRMNIVLLATYPRSGNSWTRTLFRSATQIKSDLTTARGVSVLEETGRLSRCTDCLETECVLTFIVVVGVVVGVITFVFCMCALLSCAVSIASRVHIVSKLASRHVAALLLMRDKQIVLLLVLKRRST